MDTIGIICEFNPFHNGHKYFIDEIKKMFPSSRIILIMSGNFTERGDASLVNKWDKTLISLNNNVDLVVELPTIYTIQSADTFAYASVKLLSLLKVNYLVFGSESNDIDYLKSIAKKQLSKDYNKNVKKYLDEGFNYPTALNKALGVKIDKPNDILGLSYVREIIKNKYDIVPITIKRTNDYHDKKLRSKITSASSIRENINKNVKKYVPSNSFKYLKKNISITENYFNLLKYKIISEIDNLNIYLDVDEGIDNKIKKVIYNSYSFDELINNVKSKRYTYSKLKRMFMHILLGITKEYNNLKEINYIRILGFNENGRSYLNKIKKDVNIPIYTNFNKDLEFELKITSIYASIFDKKYYNELIKKEITELIKL